MNDEEAVRRCQDGDREAFRHLVERYKDVLYGTACLMTGNPSIAEEQVQEAFLSAWRGMNSFRNGRPLKPWLVRILVNTVMGQGRRRSIQTVPLEETGQMAGPDDPAELAPGYLGPFRRAPAGDHAQVLYGTVRAGGGGGAGMPAGHRQVQAFQGDSAPAGRDEGTARNAG